jgi:hypothetical protein
MVVVFASFVLNVDPTVKMLAIGMAFAVLIDASLVRMILVPSVMSLLGERAWWMPRWLEPIVPHLELEGSIEPTEAAPVEPVAAGTPEAEVVREAEAVLKAEPLPTPPVAPEPEPVPPAAEPVPPAPPVSSGSEPVPPASDQPSGDNAKPPRAE